jgi:aminopeptidase N
VLLLALLPGACRDSKSAFSDPGSASTEDLRPFLGGLTPEDRGRLAELRGAPGYLLDLRIEDSLSELSGSLRIRYTNRGQASLDSVSFFLYPNLTPGALRLRRVEVAGQPVEPQYRYGRGIAVLPLPAPLAPGSAVELALDYSVTIPSGTDGAYGALASTTDALSLAFAYPMIPLVAAWGRAPPPPLGDFLTNEVGFYRAWVSVPAGWDLAAPGELARRTALDGRIEVSLALGPARDLCLAALRGYARKEAGEGGVRLVGWTPPGGDEAAGLALETARAALRIFTRILGAYPYSRLLLVPVPLQGAYGSEFPGAVLLASRAYDLSLVERGVSARVLLESTVAHEVAHQWFFGTVGSDQVQEPWLDEGLAQYATWLYYRERYGPAAAEQVRSSFESRWERVGNKPIPIGKPVAGYTMEEYGAVIYGRAPLFLLALSGELGETAFLGLLRDFTRRYRWRMATGEEFLAMAEERCGCSLRELAGIWGVEGGP